jgi:hypothetical protein
LRVVSCLVVVLPPLPALRGGLRKKPSVKVRVATKDYSRIIGQLFDPFSV